MQPSDRPRLSGAMVVVANGRGHVHTSPLRFDPVAPVPRRAASYRDRMEGRAFPVLGGLRHSLRPDGTLRVVNDEGECADAPRA
jgi:hypothetical protein